MSTRVRKDRKARQRDGEKYTKPQKVGTAVDERTFVVNPVRRNGGDRWPTGAQPWSSYRSPARVRKFIDSGGIKRGSSLSGRAAKGKA